MDTEYHLYMKKRYRRMAPVYDAFDLLISGIRDKVVDLADPGPGLKVLDVATGTGKQAFAFAKRGCQVTGIDLSEDMLRIARRKNRYENATFEVSDATDMPFGDNEFDVATVSLALHEMSSAVREKVVLEMLRVTRPGGTIIAVDYSLSENNPLKRIIDFLIKSFESKHYPEFAKLKLASVFKQFGIEIENEVPVLLGTVIILKGRN
ncbi:MAG: methyltransferase domain-containing protein [Actinobacteria bacterium]|nr:methyltransferase domain-containing protein [Actinomycetota bacterium]MCG2796406.1 methyltransferase domain-containing protein [Actinomycetes bacterium]